MPSRSNAAAPTFLAIAGLLALASPPADAIGLCSEPNPPSIPGGSYASASDMQSAQQAVSRYMDNVKDYRECLTEKLNETDREAEQTLNRWNRAVEAFQRAN